MDTPGDDDTGRPAIALQVDALGFRSYVVIDVDVEGRQGEEICVTATTRRSDIGLAQCLPDVDVLPGLRVFLDGSLDQLIQFVSAEGHGVSQFAVLGVPPRQFNTAFMTTVQPTLEQVTDVAAHLCSIRLECELGRDRNHPATCRKKPEGWAPPVSCQNSSSVVGLAIGCGATCWTGRADALVDVEAGLLPCQISAASTGLRSGTCSGRSIHFTIVKVGR